MINKIKNYGLTAMQLIASVVFAGAVRKLGIMPFKYLFGILILTAILWLPSLYGSLKVKKYKVIWNVYAVFVTALLIYGSVSLFQTAAAMKEISSHGDEKLDEIVVAVLADDPAETINDAADYIFGVRYVLKGDEIRQTIAAIEKETEQKLQITEYESVQEQLSALFSGKAQAVIFDEAYLSLVEEEIEGVSEKIKVIYSYSIERKLEKKPEKEGKKEDDPSFAVYISGIDVYGSIKKTSRSDVNIIAFVNPESRQILLVTTPRDFYVPLPGISGGKRDKLTHAGIYGVDVSMAALEELYDTELDFYARVNFTSLIEIVDALGGVDVNSEVAFTAGGMNVKKGMNHFNGEQALIFSRERHHVAGGDFQRGKDQQAVITAMIRKMISPAILTGAGEIIESVGKNVETDMSYEQMQELIREQLEHPGAWNVKSVAAEGKSCRQVTFSMPGRSLYVAHPVQTSIDAIKAEIAALLNGESLDATTVVE